MALPRQPQASRAPRRSRARSCRDAALGASAWRCATSPRATRRAIARLGRIARYAAGEDYHRVMRDKLRDARARDPRELLPGSRALWYSDTGAILERGWAERAGLGWIGKHSGLLSRALRLVVPARRGAGRPRASIPTPPLAARALRHVHALPRRVPDRRDRRAVPARRAAVHLVPHDRASRRDPARAAAARSATGSSAATCARTSARGTASRRPRARRGCTRASSRAGRSSASSTLDEAAFARAVRGQPDPARPARGLPAQRVRGARQSRRARPRRPRCSTTLARDRRAAGARARGVGAGRDRARRRDGARAVRADRACGRALAAAAAHARTPMPQAREAARARRAHSRRERRALDPLRAPPSAKSPSSRSAPALELVHRPAARVEGRRRDARRPPPRPRSPR